MAPADLPRERVVKLLRRQFLQVAAGAVVLPAVSHVTWGQSYPTRAVHIIVGFTAGGSTDIGARLIGQWLQERLGQSFIVENRPGAGTNIATESVVRAPPEGYTLLMVGPSSTINATLYDKLNFVFLRDIAPVASLTRQPQIMLANPSLAAKTVPEFITYAKANPGKITMASAGVGSTGHLMGEFFKMMTGVNLVHVPYRGAGPALTDLLGGQVLISFAGIAGSIEYIRTGKLRAHMFSKILIANRGEIACRIMRTAHRLGIQCVAVYSQADAHALHIKQADEAVCIGPPPSKESYLRADKIIAAALQTRAQAIHPGYGFLSENADFAAACAKAGICFIGPPIEAIHAMGSKSRAKEIMANAGVPLVPGYHGEKQDVATLQNAAEQIGYPVLLKAAAGGGGKGMRVIWQAHGFEAALASAKREALASFGNDQILVEKYLTKPRHIEIQVFADQRGNTIHLFERDCSIQRRHQKIIEEAPAPNISSQLRDKIGSAAVKAAQAVNYVGAGTVEFLLDEDGSFYFMEMNTRLQVEHPVTEMITQQDLVEWQLRVAQGEPLPYQQEQLKINGHAFEVRVYAEDPNNDFLPSIGTIKYLKTPHENKHVRLDTGVLQGDQISPYYDPMLSKLIAWDQDRHSALQQLTKALSDYQVLGVTTNLNLLNAIAQNQAFAEADLDTGFIVNHTQELFIPRTVTPVILALAGIYLLHLQNEKSLQLARSSFDPYSPWYLSDSWRLNLPAQQTLRFITDQEIKVIFHKQNEDYIITRSDQILKESPRNSTYPPSCPSPARGEGTQKAIPGDVLKASNITIKGHDISATINEQNLTANVFIEEHQIYLLHEGHRYHFALANNNANEQEATAVKSLLTSPMPGKIVALLAAVGSEVEQGAGLAIVEAMKMEHTIHAPAKGRIKEWYFQTGDLVDEGVELLKFEESGA